MASRWRAVVYVLVCLFMVSCGRREFSRGQNQNTILAEAVLESGLAAWERRSEMEQARIAADAFAKAARLGLEAANEPAAHAAVFYADCHLRFEDDETSLEAFRAQLESAAEFGRTAFDVDPNGNGIYWVAVARWFWAHSLGAATLLMVEDEIFRLAEFSAETHPTFDGHGAERLLGSLYAWTPDFAGGDMEASERKFQAAIEGAPSDGRNLVRMAREFAVVDGKPELYFELLERAVALADVSPEMACAAREARHFLSLGAVFFPDYTHGAGDSTNPDNSMSSGDSSQAQ